MTHSRRNPAEAAPGARAEVPVIVHAPLRRDAERICEVVSQRDGVPRAVPTAGEVAGHLAGHDSVLVLTQEGLTRQLRSALEDVLADQPAWSRLPILLILDRALDSAGALPELAALMVRGEVIVLHRPMRPLAFTTALDAALAARRRQLEIRDLLDFEAELKRELQHRMKNALATFMSIFKISYRQSSDIEELNRRFTERANALVAVQALFDGRRGTSGDLRTLVETTLQPYRGSDAPRILLEGPPCEVGGRFAFSLALTLNELATNAAKYGALSNERGMVRLSWTSAAEGDGTFRLDWREVGGPPVARPERTGYGTRFIEASVRSLRAEAEFAYHPDGFEFVLQAAAGSLTRE